MPALRVAVQDDPEEAEAKEKAADPLCRPLAQQHQQEIKRDSVSPGYDLESHCLFAQGSPLGEQKERVEQKADRCDYSERAKEEQEAQQENER